MGAASEASSHLLLPKGFVFSSASAGIKTSGRPDLALAEAPAGAVAAAVFTKNCVVAAPLKVGREILAQTRGRIQAVLVNSGNANCATGKAGIQGCRRVCRELGRLLGSDANQVFPSSTGIIGVPFPAAKIVRRLPELLNDRDSTEGGARRFARAIMTTDTQEKLASDSFRAGKTEVTILGVAKGSGMIHPQLATMLVYLFTDVAASAGQLKKMLREACDETFNCISVDGDTSTNDTVLLLANGESGVRLQSEVTAAKFRRTLLQVCQSLAKQIVCDGEGVKHVIRLMVEKAKGRGEAMHIARAIAHSLLVKTAWAGADPNWGRIVAAVGRSGVPVDPRKIEVEIGDQVVFRGGTVKPFNEQRAHRQLSAPECTVKVRLGRGRAGVVFYTTDLTSEYVHINADYST